MMINTIFYKLMVLVGVTLGSLYKIHQVWLNECSIESLIKIIGIIIIVWFICTPSELLQSEDR